MAPKKSSSKAAKRLEALKRSQEINQKLEDSTIEGEALLNSAGESRPSYEGHVLDLLEKPGLEAPNSESKVKSSRISRSKPKAKKSKKGRR